MDTGPEMSLLKLKGTYSPPGFGTLRQDHLMEESMEFQVTDNPVVGDNDYIIEKTREYNLEFVEKDVRPLSVYLRHENGDIIGGLTAKTFWDWLHVEYIWVDSTHRHGGVGTKLLSLAEEEAIKRGCIGSTLDTFSFQAKVFYEKQGYSKFGRLDRYAGAHQRFYMEKQFDRPI
jgi:GNAT superfamily N-acetyltransferase